MEIFALTLILVCTAIFALLEVNNILGTFGGGKMKDTIIK